MLFSCKTFYKRQEHKHLSQWCWNYSASEIWTCLKFLTWMSHLFLWLFRQTVESQLFWVRVFPPFPKPNTDHQYLDTICCWHPGTLTWERIAKDGNLQGISLCVTWSSEENNHGHGCPQYLKVAAVDKEDRQKDNLKSQCRRIYWLKKAIDYMAQKAEKFKAEKWEAEKNMVGISGKFTWIHCLH